MDSLLVLTILSSAAGLFALCRFILAGAHRSFPWFTVYLGAAALQSLVWLAGGPTDRRYVLVWASSTAILLGLRIVIVIELWRKLTPAYRNVESISRPFVWVVLVLALAVSAASGLDSLRFFGLSPQRLAYHCISLALRYSSSTLCVLCSCMSLFAIVFPRDIPRNALRHAFLLTAYFATIAIGFLAMHYDRGSAPLVGALMTGSSAGLYVLWGVLVSASGERAPAKLTPIPQAG
jgi:hypothetical protein